MYQSVETIEVVDQRPQTTWEIVDAAPPSERPFGGDLLELDLMQVLCYDAMAVSGAADTSQGIILSVSNAFHF